MIVVALVGVALVAGCGQDLPTEDDPEVQAALDELADHVRDDADATASLALDELPAGSDVLASRSYRSCVQGQHNWKINDPFDLSCHVGESVVVAVSTAATFEADMAALDRSLQAAWLSDRRAPQEESDGLAHLAEDYYGQFGHERPAGDDGESVPYGPQHLPPAYYFGDEMDLMVSFTGPDDGHFRIMDFRYRGVSGATLDGDDLLDLVADHEYALLLGVTRDETW